ncbi:hypothetical protein BDZ89DRAFT_1070082 [Hymenopellis radicata]|nr:hypothetical protein BDZ89DRAFT_1070082 [Hymenopellis radicata]
MYTRARNVLRRLVHSGLPLGTVRLVFAVLSFMFSTVAGALCVKLWTKHHTLQELLNDNLPPDVSAVIEYQDVRTTSIVLFVFNNLVTFTTSHIAIIMLHDIFKIIPPFVLRRIRLPSQKPLSSVTLAYQAAALLVSTACLIVAAAFHTQVIFSRNGKVVVHQGGAELPSRRYKPRLTAWALHCHTATCSTVSGISGAAYMLIIETVRISAEMAWPTVFFALGANVVTLAAWYQFRYAAAPIPSVEDSATESVEIENAPVLGEEEKDRLREMVLRV